MARPKTLEFNDYVETLLASVKVPADQKNIRLFFQHPLTEVGFDDRSRDRSEKVVLNLLSNALKFTPETAGSPCTRSARKPFSSRWRTPAPVFRVKARRSKLTGTVSGGRSPGRRASARLGQGVSSPSTAD